MTGRNRVRIVSVNGRHIELPDRDEQGNTYTVREAIRAIAMHLGVTQAMCVPVNCTVND